MISIARKSPVLFAAAVSALVAGCGEGKLGGTIEVNGQTSEVVSCLEGEGGQDRWVDIVAKSGERLRLLLKEPVGASGSKYRLVPKGASQAIDLKCSWATTSSSNIFGVLKGSAKLTCSAPGYSLKADVSYAKCGKQGTQI